MTSALEREVDLSEQEPAATLCHDDLHHANVLFRSDGGAWHLAALLDWDKAWAAPPESRIARMAFWDDMTGPGSWEVYRAAVPASPGAETRALIRRRLVVEAGVRRCRPSSLRRYGEVFGPPVLVSAKDCAHERRAVGCRCGVCGRAHGVR